MPLAALSGSGFAIVIGAYLALCFLIFLFRPRDIQGRKRATGCMLLLILFFGLFWIAFAAWVADALF